MRILREKLHASIPEVADHLCAAYPGVPLVALGQTVFWDEPVKAAVFAVLDALHPGCHCMRFGINDHDYFSKTAAPLPTDRPFAVLMHNDGTTRDLWVATGEINALFGSETVLTRDLLHAHGAELEKAAHEAGEERDAFFDHVTAAWGWRGIAQTGDRRQIAHEIRLADALPYVTALLCWGFSKSAALLSEESHRKSAAALAGEVVERLRRYAESYPDALLSDAYREAHRLFYERLTGRSAAEVETFSSTDALRFNPETAGRPRFRILDVFLLPETRDCCRRIYDSAVAGTQTYTLDRFGEGAIPFDLVVPGRGRGTLRVLPEGVAVATAEPIWLPTEKRVESAAELAAVTARHLGPDVAVVGKSHVFVCMINAEAILTFHEGGSAYVERTERMLRAMADAGVRVPLFPILRVRHHTWDALADTGVSFRLPDHLAEAFGTRDLCGPEFARRWREVLADQERLLREVTALGGTRELVAFLAGREDGEWQQLLEEYTRAHDLLLAVHRRSQCFEARTKRIYEETARLKQEAQEIEAAKGEDFRTWIKPRKERLWELSQQGISAGPEVERLQAEIATRDEARAEMESQIRERREGARALEEEAKAVRKERLENEKGPEAAAARKQIAAIEARAELARVKLVRRALLVARGLPQSNHRPSAWWFPLADPSGRWFESLAHRMELYFEPLSPHEPAPAQALAAGFAGQP